MSSIWVRTKSYLWGNNGDPTGSHVTGNNVTGSHVTGSSVTEEVLSGTGTFSLEVTSVTGSDRVRMATCDQRSPKGVEGCALYLPSGAFSPEVGYRKSFSRPFFLVVVQNVGWGCSLRRPHLPLSLVICPFYFHN